MASIIPPEDLEKLAADVKQMYKEAVDHVEEKARKLDGVAVRNLLPPEKDQHRIAKEVEKSCAECAARSEKTINRLRKSRVVSSSHGITITAYGMTQEEYDAREQRELEALTKACKSLRPALGRPDVQWDAPWHVDPAGDPMTAWLLSDRPLSFWERCKVGWQLWRDGIFTISISREK